MGRRGSLFILLNLLLCLCCGKVETPKVETPLRVLLWDAPQTSNPNEDYDSVTDSVLFNVFEPLIQLDGDLHLTPALATSWENPSPDLWRFHIRKGVRFHDGSLLTAKIVRQSLEHIKNAGYETSSFLLPVKSFEVIDDFTIDLVTERPYVLPIKLPFLYIFRKGTEKEFPFSGTGPYRLTRWDPNKQIEMTFFESYWNGTPEFKSVRFMPVRDPSRRWQMLQSNQAEIMYSTASFTPDNQKGLEIIRRTGLAVYYLGFSMKKENNPFHDLRVRKAIALAINKPELVQKVLHGYGLVPTQPVAPLVFGYDPEIQGVPYNISSAQKLLSETQYAAGFKTRLDVSVSRKKEALFVQDQLAKIQIQVEVNALARNSVYDLAEQGKSDFFLVGWDCSSGDAGEFYEFNLHTPDGTYGMGNYGGYSNSELDGICERHNEILNDRVRKVQLHRAARIAMQDLPIVPIYMEDDIYALKDTLMFPPRAEGQIRIFDVKRKK